MFWVFQGIFNIAIFVKEIKTQIHMENLIVTLLTHDANRAQCLAILECTDGDLRAHAQARLNVLDNNQKQAQTRCYMETPPGMVETWELRAWYIEKYGMGSDAHVDFHTISEGKKQEWYAYMNAETTQII